MTPALRSPIEVQRAHDLLCALMFDEDLGEMVAFRSPGIAKSIVLATNVLCWVLQHQHNGQFAEMLAEVERLMEEHGGVLVDLGEIHGGRKPQ